jgi:hypothetical protein
VLEIVGCFGCLDSFDSTSPYNSNIKEIAGY